MWSYLILLKRSCGPLRYCCDDAALILIWNNIVVKLCSFSELLWWSCVVLKNILVVLWKLAIFELWSAGNCCDGGVVLCTFIIGSCDPSLGGSCGPLAFCCDVAVFLCNNVMKELWSSCCGDAWFYSGVIFWWSCAPSLNLCCDRAVWSSRILLWWNNVRMELWPSEILFCCVPM